MWHQSGSRGTSPSWDHTPQGKQEPEGALSFFLSSPCSLYVVFLVFFVCLIVLFLSPFHRCLLKKERKRERKRARRRERKRGRKRGRKRWRKRGRKRKKERKK